MKVKPKIKNDWVEPFAEKLRSRTGINRLQGNAEANIFLIAPQPGKEELKNNLAWCDVAAQRFFLWMERTFSLLSNEDFLIMPCTFDGKKPVKANTDIGIDLLEASSREKQIERYVVIGSDAYRTYLGYSKKPAMEALAGNTLYLQQSGYKPVFTFPDLTALRFTEEELYLTDLMKIKARYACEFCAQRMEKLQPAFEKFLKTKKV